MAWISPKALLQFLISIMIRPPFQRFPQAFSPVPQLSGTEDKQRELPKRIHSTDTERQKHRIQQRGTGENACGNL